MATKLTTQLVIDFCKKNDACNEALIWLEENSHLPPENLYTEADFSWLRWLYDTLEDLCDEEFADNFTDRWNAAVDVRNQTEHVIEDEFQLRNLPAIKLIQAIRHLVVSRCRRLELAYLKIETEELESAPSHPPQHLLRQKARRRCRLSLSAMNDEHARIMSIAYAQRDNAVKAAYQKRNLLVKESDRMFEQAITVPYPEVEAAILRVLNRKEVLHDQETS